MYRILPALILSFLMTTFVFSVEADDTDPTISKEFAELVKKHAANMEQNKETYVGTLENRGIEIIELTLEEGCHTFIAAGESSVIDLSMSLKVDDKEVASNRTSSRFPIVTWCTGNTATVKVTLEMYNGRGGWTFGVFKGTTIGLHHKIGGGQTDFMSTRIKQIHRQFGKKRKPVSALLRDSLKVGEERVFEVKLTAGHCYTVILVADPHIRQMSISLIGLDGKEKNLVKTNSSFGHLETSPCIKKTGNYKIRIKVLKGEGQLSGQMFSD